MGNLIRRLLLGAGLAICLIASYGLGQDAKTTTKTTDSKKTKKQKKQGPPTYTTKQGPPTYTTKTAAI